jgi:hypothetical protein
MGCFSKWDPGGCGCPPCTVTVLGCGGLPVAGAAVAVYDHAGGTLLDSGTTAADGTVDLHPAGAPGYVAISRARFDPTDVAEDPCGQSYFLAPASGYSCLLDCAVPLPATLHGTVTGIPGVSAITLTVDLGTGIWSAAVTDSGGEDWLVALDSSGHGTVLNFTRSFGCGCTIESHACPPSFHYTGSGDCTGVDPTYWAGTIDITE